MPAVRAEIALIWKQKGQIMIKTHNLRLATFSVVIAISLFAPLSQMVIARSHEASSLRVGDSATDGAASYDSKCAFCHGKDGAGLPNWRSLGQPDFTKAEWQKSHTDEQIAESIKNGKGKFMPGFKSKLSEQEIGAVVQRIRAFAKKQ
jgi:mono/diheme cytochrome c family protein